MGIQEDVHQRILSLRGIENLVLKPLFTRLWESSNKKDKKQILEIIEKGDRDALNQWMQTHPDLEPGEMSIRDLRALGRKLHISNYCRMSKPELIEIIEKRGQQDGEK